MEVGIVRPVSIEEEMRGAYLDYAMSVITSRALPDVRDGLKPVQRRILYAMDELSLHHTAPYKKSARIVGEVLGKYHPHGDAPVYESMVRLAQDFSMRYPLIDGQGNFGSVDGDPPAAMRYTEARLAAIAEEMLADIDKDTVDFQPNFDDSLREPTVLPSRLPNLLLNGSSGIAVGMATNIPPHNLGEIADAIVHLIGRYSEPIEKGLPFALVWAQVMGTPVDEALLKETMASLPPAVKKEIAPAGRRGAGEPTPEALMALIGRWTEVPADDLLRIVKGPDFPTAGLIVGEEGIKSAYTSGRGRLILRSRAHFEDLRGGRTQIVVTELPYQVNKASLIEKIADLIRERRLEGISDLRDESDRQGMRIVIELKREAPPRQVLNQLFKHTAMQTAFSVNMLALVDGQPRTLTLKSALLHYINYRWEVLRRRTIFELDKARQRAHILEGLKIALDNLDEVIATIRRSRDAETARTNLMKRFKLSEMQAQAILDMQLRRLAALERQKILDELAATLKLIAHLEDLLANPGKILYLIRDEVLALKEKYGDERRTQIAAEEKVEFTEEDLVIAQEVVVAVTARGYVKRFPADSFRLGQRNRSANSSVPEDDPILQMTIGNTRGSVLFFSNRGRAFAAKARDLPEASRQARGLPLNNFTGIDTQERVVGMFDPAAVEGGFVVMVTRRGQVKRVALSELVPGRPSGVIAISLDNDDELVWAGASSGENEVVLVTAEGQAIRFLESAVPVSKRGSGGVKGIRLSERDSVVGADLARAEGELVLVTARGLAKRTPLAEFSTQGRGGGGVRAVKVSPRGGPVAGICTVLAGDEIYVATSRTALRAGVESVAAQSRVTQGAPLLTTEPTDPVLSVSRLPGTNGSSSGGSANGRARGKRASSGASAIGSDGSAGEGQEAATQLALGAVEFDNGDAGAAADGKKAAAAPKRDRAGGKKPVGAEGKAETKPVGQAKAGGEAKSSADSKPATKGTGKKARAEAKPAPARKAPAGEAKG